MFNNENKRIGLVKVMKDSIQFYEILENECDTLFKPNVSLLIKKSKVNNRSNSFECEYGSDNLPATITIESTDNGYEKICTQFVIDLECTKILPSNYTFNKHFDGIERTYRLELYRSVKLSEERLSKLRLATKIEDKELNLILSQIDSLKRRILDESNISQEMLNCIHKSDSVLNVKIPNRIFRLDNIDISSYKSNPIYKISSNIKLYFDSKKTNLDVIKSIWPECNNDDDTHFCLVNKFTSLSVGRSIIELNLLQIDLIRIMKISNISFSNTK